MKTDRNKAEGLDYIITASHDRSKGIDITRFAADINESVHKLNYYSEILADMDLVSIREVANSGDGVKYLISGTSKGFCFINIDGGFESQRRTERKKAIWQLTKTVANIGNAMIVISVAVAAIWFQYKQHQMDHQRIDSEQFFQKIEILEKVINQINEPKQ
ncbi:MAG: hypothetical protein COA58_03300 [Bacteroidetes bacterium]|nr:MAG: hypothetical protein COA58_03300 [Bacteroidota bacterium]